MFVGSVESERFLALYTFGTSYLGLDGSKLSLALTLGSLLLKGIFPLLVSGFGPRSGVRIISLLSPSTALRVVMRLLEERLFDIGRPGCTCPGLAALSWLAACCRFFCCLKSELLARALMAADC